MACSLLAVAGSTDTAKAGDPTESKKIGVRTYRIGPTRRVVKQTLRRSRVISRGQPSSLPAPAPEPDADDPETIYWVWIPGSRADQPSMHEGYWHLSGVYPLIQAHVNAPDRPSRNPPGVRGFGKGVKYGKSESWEGKRPEAAARQMVAWVRYYKLRMRRIGRPDFKYALYLNGFGGLNLYGKHPDPMKNRRNVWALGQNPKDALTADIDPRARLGAWFGANGRRLNAEWSRRFVKDFEVVRKRKKLPVPTALHFDVEGIYNINNIRLWWEPALADPRAQTELIDGEHTLVELAGQAPPLDTSISVHRKKNRDFSVWADSVNVVASEYALWQGFWKQARQVWPEVSLSNFGMTPGSEQSPYPLEKLGMERTNATLRYATHAAPYLYPLKSWAFENGKVSVAQHMKRYEPNAQLTGDEDRDLSSMNLAMAKARIDAAVASGLKVSPWLRPPSRQLNQEDLAALIQYGNERGVGEWILWSKNGYDWTGVLELVESRELASH